jgi:hypothetical protein
MAPSYYKDFSLLTKSTKSLNIGFANLIIDIKLGDKKLYGMH